MTLKSRWTNFREAQASHWAICFWEIIFRNFHATNTTAHTEMKAEYIIQHSRDITNFFSQITHMSCWSCSVLTGDAPFSGLKLTAPHKFKIILNLCGTVRLSGAGEKIIFSPTGVLISL
jgi:hypothetical protein